AGTAYNLNFDMGVFGFSSLLEMRLQVAVKDSTGTLLSQVIPMSSQGSGSWWMPEAFTFIANTNSTTLTFTDVSLNTFSADLLVDNVRVAPASGPTATPTPTPTPTVTPTATPSPTQTPIPTPTPTA